MVNIIENYSNVTGIVKSISPNEKLRGYHLVELELEKSENIGSFPNLAKADEGKQIKINVKTQDISEKKIEINNMVSFEVKKAFGQVYFLK